MKIEKPLPNLVPRAPVVEREVEGPGKGWLSHDQIFKYSWKIFFANSWVLNFCNKFSKYIGKFGHVTTSLCQGLLPHIPPQRPWKRGWPLPYNIVYKMVSNYDIINMDEFEIMDHFKETHFNIIYKVTHFIQNTSIQQSQYANNFSLMSTYLHNYVNTE